MELVILIGLQASGKSTFARTRFGASHVYISKDAMPNVWKKELCLQKLIEEALSQGCEVVVVNKYSMIVD